MRRGGYDLPQCSSVVVACAFRFEVSEEGHRNEEEKATETYAVAVPLSEALPGLDAKGEGCQRGEEESSKLVRVDLFYFYNTGRGMPRGEGNFLFFSLLKTSSTKWSSRPICWGRCADAIPPSKLYILQFLESFSKRPPTVWVPLLVRRENIFFTSRRVSDRRRHLAAVPPFRQPTRTSPYLAGKPPRPLATANPRTASPDNRRTPA